MVVMKTKLVIRCSLSYRNDMKWQELTVYINRDAEEIVSHLLIENGSQGVAIKDSADYVGQKDRFGELYPEIEQSDNIAITAYYPETIDLETITKDIIKELETLSTSGFLPKDYRIDSHELSEENWAENWKKYYEPTRITHDLTIVPSWTSYAAQPNEMVIKLDPGMAFGTGTHPTTKMSLYALEQVLRGGETVIDVGTGSGVLSIASSLLGARDIFAYDLDDVAVRVAKDNIDLNAHTQNIQVRSGDLLKGVTISADVIVANILADILILLIDDAYQLLKEDGFLILSGIISDKLEMLLEVLKGTGFVLETHLIQGEWNTLILKKTDDISGIVGG